MNIENNDVAGFYTLAATSIALGATRAVILDRKGLPHILPLLTMTGVSYLPARGGKKK